MNTEMQEIFELQRKAYLQDPRPTIEWRKKQLDILKQHSLLTSIIYNGIYPREIKS